MKKGNSYYYKCICECGNQTIVERSCLVRGKVVSCGCYHKEQARELKTTHGMWGTKTYWAWAQAKQRCTNPSYTEYCGRGITMCYEWLESFSNFLNDMGECPNIKSSLDRIDNDKGYFKENCHWATKSFQGFNRRITKQNTSGKTGVSFMKTKSKWRAYITVNNKQISLGLFVNLSDAINARTQAELQYYGKTKQ